MCRTGGRRCPGQDTPEGRAARNARRRAQYAARKGKGGTASGNPTEANTSAPTAIVDDVNVVPTAEKLNNLLNGPDTVTVKPSMKVSTIQEDSTTSEKLELGKVSPIFEKGELGSLKDTMANEEEASDNSKGVNQLDMPDHGASGLRHEQRPDGKGNVPKYELSTVMKGTIDYDKLDDESYRYFGFTEGFSYDTVAGTKSYSDKELKAAELSPSERGAILAYTGSSYEELNRALYNPEKYYSNREDNPTDLSEEELEEKMSLGESIFLKDYYWNAPVGKDKYQMMAKKLDEALVKGNKVQRRVFRGVNFTELGFNDIDPWSKEYPTRRDAWIDENRSVGTVIEYKGYLSSSLTPQKAASFGKSSGIVYEMITPEGLAVETNSYHKGEKEVLLPRNCKFVVVGVQKGVQSPADHWDKCTLIQLVAVNSKGEILDGTNSDPLDEPFTNNA